MSGGSLDYAYQRVRDMALELAQRATRLEHRALASHLSLVAQALHDTEWVLSGDYEEGQELEAIAKAVGPNAALEQAITEARDAQEQLSRLLAQEDGKPVEQDVIEARENDRSHLLSCCGSCRAWHRRLDFDDIGECRLHPPLTSDAMTGPRWQYTRPYDWCLDYRDLNKEQLVPLPQEQQ